MWLYIIPLFSKSNNHGQHSLQDSEKYNLLHILIFKCWLKQVEMSSSNYYVLIYLKVQNHQTCTYSIYKINSYKQPCTFLDALVSKMKLSATEYPGHSATSGYSSLHPMLFIYRCLFTKTIINPNVDHLKFAFLNAISF